METITLGNEVIPIESEAKDLIVNSPVTYVYAGNFLLSIKSLRKKIADVFDPIIQKAFQAHKEAVAQKKALEAPLFDAEIVVKNKVAIYQAEEERKRAEEEARLFAEAKRQDEERRLAEAIALEKSGYMEEANAIIKEETPVIAPILPKSIPKVEGIAAKEIWKFEITNSNLIPRSYLIPDEKKIGGVVRAMKDKTDIPGIRVYSEKIVSVRGFQ